MEKLPKISLIAALGADKHEIGTKGKLLWHIPEDLKHFKEATIGKPVIMGRATFESLDKALPGRHNIVLSRDIEYGAEGCDVVHSLEQALAMAGEKESEEIFIIGGGAIYKQALEQGVVDRLYLTQVEGSFPEADTHFPEYDGFTKVIKEHSSEDETFKYKFVTLERDEDKEE